MHNRTRKDVIADLKSINREIQYFNPANYDGVADSRWHYRKLCDSRDFFERELDSYCEVANGK